jgi:hypothetical protein
MIFTFKPRVTEYLLGDRHKGSGIITPNTLQDYQDICIGFRGRASVASEKGKSLINEQFYMHKDGIALEVRNVTHNSLPLSPKDNTEKCLIYIGCVSLSFKSRIFKPEYLNKLLEQFNADISLRPTYKTLDQLTQFRGIIPGV